MQHLILKKEILWIGLLLDILMSDLKNPKDISGFLVILYVILQSISVFCPTKLN